MRINESTIPRVNAGLAPSVRTFPLSSLRSWSRKPGKWGNNVGEVMAPANATSVRSSAAGR